jgi:hypothetical protein
MTALSPSRPRPQILGISHPWSSGLSGSSHDSTAVAVAIAGTGWSRDAHEAPDYERA